MITIPIKPGSNTVVRITDESISFDGWSVDIKNVIGVQFMSSESGYLVSANGGYVTLRTDTSKYTISARNYGVMGFFEGTHNMPAIAAAVIKATGKHILTEYINKIFLEGIPVTIGCLQFNIEGIRKNGLFPSQVVSWRLLPYHTSGVKLPGPLGFGKGWIFGATVVCYDDPSSGKRREIGSVSGNDLNGFLVPSLLDFARKLHV